MDCIDIHVYFNHKQLTLRKSHFEEDIHPFWGSNSSFTYFHWQFPPQEPQQIKAKHNIGVIQYNNIQKVQRPLCSCMGQQQIKMCGGDNVFHWHFSTASDCPLERDSKLCVFSSCGDKKVLWSRLRGAVSLRSR